jgi:hypothetical protein
MGGLENRLMPMSSCWVIAQKTGRRFSILWRNDDMRCRVGYNKLFDQPQIRIVDDDQLAGLTDSKTYADLKDTYENFYLTHKDSLIKLIHDQAYEKLLQAFFPGNVIIRPKLDRVRKADDCSTAWVNNTLTSKASVLEAVIDIYLLPARILKSITKAAALHSLSASCRPASSRPHHQNRWRLKWFKPIR